jgi:hypothetical protein
VTAEDQIEVAEESAYEAPAIEDRSEIAKPLIGFSQER